MFYCRNCSGKLYEEEIFTEEDETRYMQVGCLKCPKKIYVELKKWEKLKRQIELAILKKRNNNARSKDNK